MDPHVFSGIACDLRTTVAMFASPQPLNVIRELYRITLGELERLAYPANVAGVTLLKSHGRSYGRYRRLTASVERLLEQDNLVGVEIAYVPPPETDAVRFGWLTASIDDQSFVFSGRKSIVELGDSLIADLLAPVSRIMSPSYGYAYVLDEPYGPGFHALGIGCVSASRIGIVPPLPENEDHRTGRWSNQRKKALAIGTLRDVYPLNYLTQVHSARKVGGQPLFEWIATDASRGQLEVIRPGAWLWRVPEEHCLELGRELESAGLLI